MHCIGMRDLLATSVFWCPRCGTAKTGNRIETPRIIPRIRALFDAENLPQEIEKLERDTNL